MKIMKNELRNIFLSCLHSVNPTHLIRSSVSVKSNELLIKNNLFPLNRNCYLVGFGKAVYEMALEMESILNDHLREGIISVPIGIRNSIKSTFHDASVVRVFEGAKNNLPDNNSYEAAINIKNLVQRLQKDDILIVLISGGGSALLSYPIPPITVNEKLQTIKLISSAGGDIVELNSVRKALSVLKGGKLSRLAYPATVVTLILSDVIGDPIESIASGPTVLHEDVSEKAVEVLQKYKLLQLIPVNVKDVLFNHQMDDSDVSSDEVNTKVHNIVIGNNILALEAARREAERCKYSTIVCSSEVSGLVTDVANFYTLIIEYIIGFMVYKDKHQFTRSLQHLLQRGVDDYRKHFVERILENVNTIESTDNPICLICGGEPTVKVTGNGIGGRNQELTLGISVKLYDLKKKLKCFNDVEVLFLSAGTDGIDGPTDAAGAICYVDLIQDAFEENLNPICYLENNDSYSFFSQFKNQEQLIKIGNTGTNVMDIHIIFIKRKVN